VYRAAGVSATETENGTTAVSGTEVAIVQAEKKTQNGWTPRSRKRSSSLVHKKISSAGRSR
jgi:hypothetical protein